MNTMTAAADQVDGLVFACLLDGQGGGRALDWEGVESWGPQDGVLWVHLDYNVAAARDWILRRSGMPETAAETLTAGETRPRSLQLTQGTLVTLRGVNLNPGADPEDMVSIRTWLERERIVTTRHRLVLSVQDIRADIERGQGPLGPGDFLARLTHRLADRIGDTVERLEEELARAEQEVTDADIAAFRARLSALRRETAGIRRYLAPQRDALDRLYRQPGGLLREAEAADLREQADRITRYLEDLELARERALVIQEELMNRLALEQNSRMYLLSLVAAVFLPLTFATGLLGMNVAGLPGTEDPAAFMEVVAGSAAVAVLILLYFKWRRWI